MAAPEAPLADKPTVQLASADEDTTTVAQMHDANVGDVVGAASDEPAAEGADPDAAAWTTVPADAVDISNDGKIKKIIVTEGVGDTPTLHARCLVHYIGRLLSNGDIFMDTKKEYQSGQPAQVVAGRDTTSRETGLNLAVATMKVGEVAKIYVLDPEYGYGEKGSFSFPCVPPSAQLAYELELQSWEPVEEGAGQLRTYEDKLEAAERRRLAGNELFKEGKYKEAINKYVMALSYMDEDFMMQLQGHHLDKAEAVKAPLHLNLAACQLRTGDQTTAIYNCGQVLELQPKNVKALFRRGVARHQLGQTEEAMQDLEAALKLDPNDGGIQKEIRAVKQTIKAERQAEAALFRGRLGPAPPPAGTAPAATPSVAAPAQDTSSSKDAGGGAGAGGVAQPKSAAASAAVPPAGVVGSLVHAMGFGYGMLSGLVGWLLRLGRGASR